MHVLSSVCGKRTYYNRGKITGGSSARHGSYPWMAMLYRHPCTQNCLFCGGSILDNKYVITAAHCIVDNRNRSFIVRVGAHQVQSNVGPEWWCTVKNVAVHPSYDHASYDYDVALIQLGQCNSTLGIANEIVMSPYIRPICLPNPSSSADQHMYAVGESGTGAGWGKRKATPSVSGNFAKVLRHVELPISNKQKCQAHFSPQNWIVTTRMFCAIANGEDTCHGDSGGPFMAQQNPTHNPRFVLLGIISWGDARCGTGYGVYTKVISIMPWIKETVGN